MNPSKHLLLLTLTAFLASVPLASNVNARERHTTVYGSRGGVYHRDVTHVPGSFSASESATLPSGRTASRSIATQRTDTGRTTTAQATYLNGKTATYGSTRTDTANGYTRQVNATGPNGGTVSKEINVSHENGTVTRSVTTTKTPPTP